MQEAACNPQQQGDSASIRSEVLYHEYNLSVLPQMFYFGGVTMSFQMIRMATINRLSLKNVVAALIGVCFITGVAIGEEHKLSDKFDMYVDYAAKQKFGEQTFH